MKASGKYVAHRQQHLSILLAHRAMIEEASKEPRPSIDVSKNSRLMTRRLEPFQTIGQQQGISDTGVGRRGKSSIVRSNRVATSGHCAFGADGMSLLLAPGEAECRSRPQGFLQQRITDPGLKLLQGPRASVNGASWSRSPVQVYQCSIENYTTCMSPLLQLIRSHFGCPFAGSII